MSREKALTIHYSFSIHSLLVAAVTAMEIEKEDAKADSNEVTTHYSLFTIPSLFTPTIRVTG